MDESDDGDDEDRCEASGVQVAVMNILSMSSSWDPFKRWGFVILWWLCISELWSIYMGWKGLTKRRHWDLVWSSGFTPTCVVKYMEGIYCFQ
jgi:hypothetical protein